MQSLTKKKKLTDKQESFMKHYFNVDCPETFGNGKQSTLKAGYSENSYEWLITSMRDEIVERAKLEFAATSPKAVKKIVDSMTAPHDEGEPLGRTELRFKAAQDILDRAGVTKKQEMSVESKNLHAVVILPQKTQHEEEYIYDPDGRAS
jgi:hypothetical protein